MTALRRAWGAWVTTPVDLETLVDAPVLAVLPRQRHAWRAGLTDAGADPFAELIATMAPNCPHVLVVTSARSGEGKTTVASTLARVLARRGRRVLLVDAETRRGDLHAVFGIPASPGLFDVMYGERGLAEAVQSVRLGDDETIDILPSGGVANHAAGDLLIGGILAPFVARLRAAYDHVIVDTPALGDHPDAALVAPHADATVLVVADDLLNETAITSAVDRLWRAGAAPAGIVRVTRAAGPTRRSATA